MAFMLAMSFRLSLVVLVWCLYSVESCPVCERSNLEYDNDWEAYKAKYDKVYRICHEECKRRLLWEDKCKIVDDFNRKAMEEGCSYNITLNKFADWTDEEISEGLHGLVVPSREISDEPESESPTFPITPPTYFDYTDHGYVTPVKHQGTCGNCWAFSAAGAIEGQLYKSCGQLIDVSVQQLNDCCNDDATLSSYNCHGCKGGWMNGAFRCMKDLGGIVTSDVYGLVRSDEECDIPDESEERYRCDGFSNIAPYDESSLMQHLLTVGPIACTMDASRLTFTLYKDGIYSDPECPTAVNHAVLITGCGTTSDGLDYWIIKNSWGTDWGENGYFRMIRDSNHCDIAHYCSYPVNCTAVEAPPSD